MDSNGGKVRRTIICLIMLVSGATGLKDVMIKVPSMVKSGDAVLLMCSYDLEGADLYTIKWYHEDVEFYRFVPKEAPPHAAFPVQGIKIDVSNSNKQNVTLVNVSRELTGRYKCEVSADAPSYHTEIREASMIVVDVPETDPTIMAERKYLSAGETLRANCTSGTSRPAPAIRWTLNEDFLKNGTVFYKVWNRKSIHGEMEVTRSILELTATEDLFRDGRLTLGCFTEIPDVYEASAVLDIIKDPPLKASITGDASPHSHHSSGYNRVGLSGTSELLITFLVGSLLAVSAMR